MIRQTKEQFKARCFLHGWVTIYTQHVTHIRHWSSHIEIRTSCGSHFHFFKKQADKVKKVLEA